MWVQPGQESWNYIKWEALGVNYEYGKSRTCEYQQITEKQQKQNTSTHNISSLCHLWPIEDCCLSSIFIKILPILLKLPWSKGLLPWPRRKNSMDWQLSVLDILPDIFQLTASWQNLTLILFCSGKIPFPAFGKVTETLGSLGLDSLISTDDFHGTWTGNRWDTNKGWKNSSVRKNPEDNHTSTVVFQGSLGSSIWILLFSY